MRNFDTKTIVIASAASLAAIALAIGTVMLFAKPKWSEQAAVGAFDSIVDIYDDAIAQFPHERNKALFTFDTAVVELLRIFKEEYGQFEEYAAWEAKFNNQVKDTRAALRKA